MKVYLLYFAMFFLLSCSDTGIPQPSFEYSESEAGLSNQANPQDLRMIIAAGPLYTMSLDIDNPTVKTYRKLRNNKVNEIIEQLKADNLLLSESLESFPEYRTQVLSLLGFLSDKLDVKDPDQKKLKVYVLDTAEKFTNSVIKTTALQVNLEGLAKTLSGDSNSAPTTALFWYSYYYQSMLLTKQMSYELSYFPGRLVGIVSYIQENEDKFSWWSFRRVVNGYEDDLEDFLTDIQDSFQEAISNQLDVAVGLRYLKAGDYAFTKACLEYSNEAAAEIKKIIDRTPIRGSMTKEDKDFYYTYAKFIKQYSSSSLNDFNKIEEPRELAFLEPSYQTIPNFPFSVAHAGVSDWLGKTASSITKSTKNMGSSVYGGVSSCVTSPWQCTKKSFQNVQKGIGMSVDSVNMAVGAGMDVGMNLYYGNSIKDLKDITGKNMVKMYKTWDEGKMGSTVLRTARDYLDGTEKTVGKATAGLVENVWGKGYISWGAGKLGEITTNMATGFGKGALALANPESTSEELVEGALDVAFSFTGGSKSVVKGSQIAGGAKKIAKELSKKGATQLEKLAVKMQTKSLRESSNKILKTASKKLSEGQLQIIYSNTKQIVANEAKERILKETEKNVSKIINDVLKKSGKKVWGNLKGVPGNIKNFSINKFDDSLKGFGKASKEIFGGSLRQWGNNVFSSIVDTQIKDHAKGLVSDSEKNDIKIKEHKLVGLFGLPHDDPSVKEALKKIGKAMNQANTTMKKVDAAADNVAKQAVQAKIDNTIVQTAIDKAKKELSKPVSAHGSFSGSYSGSVSMRFAPIGGPIKGTVKTSFGSASISGTVSKSGSVTARVSGGMRYEDYDGTWKNCSLRAKMTGKVSKRKASGTYGGRCAREGDSGRWSVSW